MDLLRVHLADGPIPTTLWIEHPRHYRARCMVPMCWRADCTCEPHRRALAFVSEYLDAHRHLQLPQETWWTQGAPMLSVPQYLLAMAPSAIAIDDGPLHDPPVPVASSTPSVASCAGSTGITLGDGPLLDPWLVASSALRYPRRLLMTNHLLGEDGPNISWPVAEPAATPSEPAKLRQRRSIGRRAAIASEPAATLSDDTRPPAPVAATAATASGSFGTEVQDTVADLRFIAWIPPYCFLWFLSGLGFIAWTPAFCHCFLDSGSLLGLQLSKHLFAVSCFLLVVRRVGAVSLVVGICIFRDDQN